MREVRVLATGHTGYKGVRVGITPTEGADSERVGTMGAQQPAVLPCGCGVLRLDCRGSRQMGGQSAGRVWTV